MATGCKRQFPHKSAVGRVRFCADEAGTTALRRSQFRVNRYRGDTAASPAMSALPRKRK